MDKYGSLIITTTNIIKDLINYTELLCIMLIVFSRYQNKDKQKNTFPIERIMKYAKLISNLDCNFYLRYYFSKQLLQNKEYFYKIHPILENSSQYKIKLAYGDTQTQRFNFAISNLDLEHNLLDIGTGEGFYLQYAKLLQEKNKIYYGIDTDPKVLELAKHKAEKMELKNVSLFLNLENLKLSIDNTESINIILLEVIEHMSIEEAEKLIHDILTTISFHKFLISTPNYDFNKFYSQDQTYRHHDHKWEMTSNEFNNWMFKIL